MDIVVSWTGSTACAFQRAYRLTNESFAAQLRIAPRTVAKWHATPDGELSSQMQRILDTAYAEADIPVRERFKLLLHPPRETQAAALRVAIAVVLRGTEVLLVQRRDAGPLAWQFPAGIVKPGAAPESVAIQEAHAETGIHAAIREHLGSRIHPVTGTLCEYYAAEYLAGEAVNRDALENAAVQWVAIASLTRFIQPDRIYRPVLDALGVSA
ncbi:NUDIX hydrolase [Streptomyces sp. NPDC059538]|uniref:NUDIX hydrolase n=1 Tax=Streptomyces sp. NPDC059538 TaxID=3346860 RepID=UPI0036B338AA